MIEISCEPASADPNGVPFTVLTSGGPKEEGKPFPALFDTAGEAWAHYGDALYAFKGDYETLYWRHRPELQEVDGKFVVYSRVSRA